MSTISIELPDHLKAYLEEQAARRGYGSTEEFVSSLLKAEQERSAHQEIDALLLETVDGPFEEWTDADMEDVRKTGRAIIERRKSGK